jgi:cyclohexadienyl dehydratase
MGFLRLLILMLVLVLPVQAAEQSRLDAIIEKGVLRVGTTGDYKPFTSFDKASGQYSGLDIDMAQGLAGALGVSKVVFVKTDWPNLMADLAADKFDIGMGGITISLERQKKAFFSYPYLRDGKSAIALCKNKKKFPDLASIDKSNVKVITPPGGTNEKFDRAFLKNAQIIVFQDNTKIFDEIIAGRADVMITDSTETRFQQKQHPNVLCAINPDKPFDFAEKAYLLPRDQVFKNFVDQWLYIVTRGSGYKKALAKWVE